MTDTGNSAPAGWFPDPSGTPRQRYWDGAQWTEHFHPPLTEPVAEPTPTTPKKKGKAGFIALIAGGVAVILGVTSFFVWGLPALTGGSNGTVYSDPSWDYSYTTPMLNIDRDHEFEFAADFDFEELEDTYRELEPEPTPDPSATPLTEEEQEWADDSYVNPSFAFEVFYDAAFTKRAELFVMQYEPGESIFVLPHDSATGWTAEGHHPRQIMDEEFGGWGLHSEYYLMRKIDEKGELLDKPVVTKFTVKSELEAPVVTFSTADNDGNLTMTWDPVEGADRYIVVASNASGITTSRSLTILDQAEDTTWSSSIVSKSLNEKAPWATTQNDDMTMFEYGSADSITSGFSNGSGSGREYDFGVIASNGVNFSPYNTYDAIEIAGTLPYETAFGASRDLKNWGRSGFIDGIENVQTTLPFTSLDGTTRSTIGYIVAENVVEYPNRWVLPLMGRGTNLGEWIPISKASVPDLGAAIKAFNKRAEEEAPTTGMTSFETLSAPLDQIANGVKDVPETEYPVYGSNDYSKFLAGHFIAQTRIIDISDWTNKPGMPETMDAAWEARYQNPYAISLKGMQINNAGTTLTVEYTFTAKVASGMQAELFAKTQKVIKDVVRGKMKDAQKVAVLNAWLVDNAEYDHAALANKDKGLFGGVPLEYANAWNANGVLVDGIGVCASYAYAFNALANQAGVETVVITGDVTNGGLHAWNKVKIDGTWKAVDSTWNDSTPRDEFLMITDAQFTGSATRTQDQAWIADVFVADYATK